MKELSYQELHDLGVIQEINRRQLHPRGLCLVATTGDDDQLLGLKIVDDCNEDVTKSKVFSVGDMDQDFWNRAGKFNELLNRVAPDRIDAMGSSVQPIVLDGVKIPSSLIGEKQCVSNPEADPVNVRDFLKSMVDEDGE